MPAKFIVFLDKGKKFRFNLKSSNGQVIASSEGYDTKASCLNGIKSVRKNAPEADLSDETLEVKPKDGGKKPVRKGGRTRSAAAKTPEEKA